jgi:hypothetical protein
LHFALSFAFCTVSFIFYILFFISPTLKIAQLFVAKRRSRKAVIRDPNNSSSTRLPAAA